MSSFAAAFCIRVPQSRSISASVRWCVKLCNHEAWSAAGGALKGCALRTGTLFSFTARRCHPVDPLATSTRTTFAAIDRLEFNVDVAPAKGFENTAAKKSAPLVSTVCLDRSTPSGERVRGHKKRKKSQALAVERDIGFEPTTFSLGS